MVYFYQSQPDPSCAPHWVIVGADKFENDLLIKHSYRDLQYHWFHTDKYSSAHIYLKLQDCEKSWEDVSRDVINDCLQLCKSQSIQGNKLPQCTIIHTPWHNLKKSGYMKPGEVSFKSMKSVKKLECYGRDNNVLNRLNKTRIELVDDTERLLHEAKKSKDGMFFVKYLNENREKLIEDKNQRAIAKREAKKKKKGKNQEEEDSFYNSDNATPVPNTTNTG